MFNLATNISKRERIVRGAIGGLLLIGIILGLGRTFAFLIGAILIAEASLSHCFIIDLIERFKLDQDKPAASTDEQTKN